MTYRDRRLARAERLRGWADTNDAKSTTAAETSSRMADAIPFGQPILLGHYSEGRDRRYRERIRTQIDRAVEYDRKAQRQESTADEIERQAGQAIYDDDPDAIERLRAKLAKLEAKRDALKAHNVAARKARACMCPDDCACHSQFRPTVCGCTQHPLPAYVLQNLGGTITTTRQRLARLEKRQANTGTTAKPPRLITLRFGDTCSGPCRRTLHAGDRAWYDRSEKTMTCGPCHEGDTDQ